MFEFPLSCHVQILDLPTRFVKLLAKLSSPQQRSTDFLYLRCKLFHNIYTIILEPSPHRFIPFSLTNFIVSYFFLSQQQLRVCVYIYISLQFVESRNEQCILSIVISLFRMRFLILGQQLSILVACVILPIFRSSSSVPLFFLEFFSRRGKGKSLSQRIR